MELSRGRKSLPAGDAGCFWIFALGVNRSSWVWCQVRDALGSEGKLYHNSHCWETGGRIELNQLLVAVVGGPGRHLNVWCLDPDERRLGLLWMGSTPTGNSGDRSGAENLWSVFFYIMISGSHFAVSMSPLITVADAFSRRKVSDHLDACDLLGKRRPLWTAPACRKENSGRPAMFQQAAISRPLT